MSRCAARRHSSDLLTDVLRTPGAGDRTPRGSRPPTVMERIGRQRAAETRRVNGVPTGGYWRQADVRVRAASLPLPRLRDSHSSGRLLARSAASLRVDGQPRRTRYHSTLSTGSIKPLIAVAWFD